MKQIEIKTSEVKFPDGRCMTTIDTIKWVLDFKTVSEGGILSEQIFKNNRIRQALKDLVEGNPILIMEDADFDELIKLSKTVKWPADNMFFYEFEEEIKAAKSFKPASLSDLKPSENGTQMAAEIKQS